MSEENKEVVRRFFHELWNTGNIDAVDELMDPGCDGDFSYSISANFPFSAEEAFNAARSPSYAESGMAARMKEFAQSHPDLAKVIRKGLILRSEGNFRGVIKSRARRFRESVPDVTCTIDEMFAQQDLVWVRWTLRGTLQCDVPSAGIALSGRAVTVTGASICLLQDGTIRDYRSQSTATDRWLESVLGIVPRP
jgi:hypothetical protein